MPERKRKMSVQYNIMKTTGVTGTNYTCMIGKKEPLAHPKNCKHECPYGYDRTFCFPCYAKIMAGHKERLITAKG